MRNKVNVLASYFLSGMILFGFSAAVSAQAGVIKGKVIDAKTNENLIGASVMIVGTTKGTTSDLEGNYIIRNIAAGFYEIRVSYISYVAENQINILVESGKETVVDFLMKLEERTFKDVEVVGRSNRQSETILLNAQKVSLLSTQAVGGREMSRKGVGNAEAAVAQVSGISKQEGIKNVFVRGLGDRYNATLLNGFPIPSEDPEYKNIALEFFSADMIQHIDVNKVFESSNAGDVGGAIININSKDLFGEQAFGVEASAGLNTEVTGVEYLRQSGSDYLGFANSEMPAADEFSFGNSLDPSVVKMPVNQSYTLSGGKLFRLGEDKNPLSFFVVASYAVDYTYTRETVRNAISNGTIYLDQTGEKYSQSISQLVLTNVNYTINHHLHIAYNFMMLHASNQYVGEYYGMNGEKYQDAEESGYIGFLRRQQTNDNQLFTHQLISDWKLSEKLKFNAGVSSNTITGLEPDRRENNLSKQGNSYIFTGSNRQKRFYSELNERDFNIRTALRYQLNDSFDSASSALIMGYDGRFVDDRFYAVEYNFTAYPGYYSIDNLKLDDCYNQANYSDEQFIMTKGDPNSYNVTKYIHSGYIEGNYQVVSRLVANLGLRFDYVDMTISHQVQHVSPGKESIQKPYFLPSMNLKYELNDKNALRLGMSKTYTLPQSKEISPYQYVNIGFASQGNQNLRPSENYNVDIKWDNYLSPSEVISVNGFYKYVVKPIGRVDEGNSAGLLTYENISPSALVAGLEFEMRKNLINKANETSSMTSRLSLGVNASYIYTDLVIDIENTAERHSRLEGAAPFITNVDFSYNRINENKNLLASLVFGYFSDRIHTIGTMGYKDIIEKGLPTLNVVSSYKWNKNFTIKLKMANLLDPAYRLTRESSSGQEIVLNEYKKGMNISLGILYNL